MRENLPAVHDNRPVLVLVVGRGFFHEAEHGQRILRYAMVGPIGVVVLIDRPLDRLVLAGLDLGVPDLERPDGVGGEDLLVGEGDLDQPIRLRPLSGPVEIAFSLQEE